jgi:hypothetical protein
MFLFSVSFTLAVCVLVFFFLVLTLLRYRRNTLQFGMVPQCNRMLKYNNKYEGSLHKDQHLKMRHKLLMTYHFQKILTYWSLKILHHR